MDMPRQLSPTRGRGTSSPPVPPVGSMQLPRSLAPTAAQPRQLSAVKSFMSAGPQTMVLLPPPSKAPTSASRLSTKSVEVPPQLLNRQSFPGSVTLAPALERYLSGTDLNALGKQGIGSKSRINNGRKSLPNMPTSVGSNPKQPLVAQGQQADSETRYIDQLKNAISKIEEESARRAKQAPDPTD